MNKLLTEDQIDQRLKSWAKKQFATQDKLANAKASAKATYENIKELVEALDNAGANETDEPLQAIYEHPLSIEVRSDWSAPGTTPFAVEYRILISTGGPAVQITGELNEYLEPKTAELECQDWFQPWTRVSWQELGYTFEELMDLSDKPSHPKEIMLAYARCFYFGE